MTRILYLIFFLSGATGLVYEVIWGAVDRSGFRQHFPFDRDGSWCVHGRACAGKLGAWFLFGQVCPPLRLYGILEIAIGISAALVPVAFRAMDTLYWGLVPSLSAVPGVEGLVRFTTSFVIMLVPTFLMGGTLPILTRFFVRQVDEVESKLGALYAVNTFGAAGGTLLAALVLIPGLGNQTTTIWIASMNIAIGLVAIRLDLGRESVPEISSGFLDEEDEAVVDRESDRLVLVTLAISGFVAMTYEVAWTRALTAVIGSSTYAFAIMLVTFLVGIAFGVPGQAVFVPAPASGCSGSSSLP